MSKSCADCKHYQEGGDFWGECVAPVPYHSHRDRVVIVCASREANYADKCECYEPRHD